MIILLHNIQELLKSNNSTRQSFSRALVPPVLLFLIPDTKHFVICYLKNRPCFSAKNVTAFERTSFFERKFVSISNSFIIEDYSCEIKNKWCDLNLENSKLIEFV